MYGDIGEFFFHYTKADTALDRLVGRPLGHQPQHPRSRSAWRIALFMAQIRAR